jgi:hypothetical protein
MRNFLVLHRSRWILTDEGFMGAIGAGSRKSNVQASSRVKIAWIDLSTAALRKPKNEFWCPKGDSHFLSYSTD